ncbi:class D sortase [Neobacillus notoginsengisoli]|uniref:Class D sortase n=1 Tax=Neobacillus notoginsengisoli TaxID=1578198 RepID=A0A417YRA9_9BACI|nr:class D sortase [Neobacillus notoginsengisoli]RHW37392.1 class D sortase [Neobacillus notoginsengisoli]
MLLFGAWFTTTNVYKFAKGYLTYKVSASKPVEKKQENEKQEEKKDPRPVKKQLYSRQPEIGEEIGSLYIPKLDATLPIYHGTNEDELEKGVGHYADSVLPGEKDNSVLSGHRDTVFRKLGEVGVGDMLVVTTEAGKFEYKVRKVRIVDADDRTVIVPKPRAMLTVTTCYPFNFIGNAPDRYILSAFLVTSELNEK